MVKEESNSWKNALPPGIDEYAKFINKDWDDFRLDVKSATAK
jgi:hypothetical protein